MKKFEPRLCSFSTLLKKRRLIIPSDFQRSYKWDRKFWKPWLEDIIELVKLNQANEIHFVGGIAIKQMSEQNQTDLYIDYQVIDGQQRITTVFVLLLAILNSPFLDKERDAETIFHIRELLFLERGRDEEKNDKLRLLAISQNKDYDEEEEDILTKIIKKSPDLETIKGNKILEAYNFFVDEIGNDKLARDLDRIIDKIKENLMFILIETDTQEDGRKVFETINRSRLDLTQADKIKVFLSTRWKEKNLPKHKWITKWTLLIKNIGEDNLDHFFFCYLNIGTKKKEYTGSKFIDYFKKEAVKKPIKILLDEIVEISNIYKEILNPSHDFWDENYYQRIIELNILGKKVRGLYSFVILLRKYEEDENVKTKTAVNILEKVILYVFRKRFWSDRGVHWQEIDRWNQKVRDNQLNTILQDPNIVKEINSIGFWNALEKETNASKEKNKYLLSRVYFTLVPKGILPNFSNLQIEHLFPETPSEEWSGIPQWNELEPKEIKEKLLNSIGNLTLLSSQQNIDSRNYTWEIKKREVQTKTFLSLENNELDLFNEKQFLPEHINIRRKWLITQFKDKGILFIDSEKEKKIIKKIRW